MYRVIGERSLDDLDATAATARRILWDMVLARTLDERAVSLQRRGWMSGYPPFEGQEASQVGAAHALAAADWLFPTYRANAMQLARGRPTAALLQFRRGRSSFAVRSEEDPDTSAARGSQTFTQATPIATHLPHAVGAAMAAASRHDRADDGTDGSAAADHVVCAYFGDGATSEGDFHEAMNLAGVFDAPGVFLCENNAWAISTPVDRQTASETIAAKADAYGFDGVRVDGNDPLAVYTVVAEARDRALAGDPVLVESLTYRQGAHTTSDDPSRYREDPDLPDWRTADPLDRYVDYLTAEGLLREGWLDAVTAWADAAVDDAVAAVEAAPEPDPDDLFEDAYATLPGCLERQRQWLREREERRESADGCEREARREPAEGREREARREPAEGRERDG